MDESLMRRRRRCQRMAFAATPQAATDSPSVDSRERCRAATSQNRKAPPPGGRIPVQRITAGTPRVLVAHPAKGLCFVRRGDVPLMSGAWRSLGTRVATRFIADSSSCAPMSVDKAYCRAAESDPNVFLQLGLEERSTFASAISP